MASQRDRFSDLWRSQGFRSTRRRGRRSFREAITGAERLESRAMLAISAAYYDDFISVPPAGSGTAWGDNNANTGHGVLVVTIDGTGGSDDVFMRVINGNYQIGTSRNFATGDLVTITHPGYTAPSVAPVTGAPGDGTFTIGTSIASNFSNLYRLQTANPVTTATPVTPGTSALFTSTSSPPTSCSHSSALKSSPSSLTLASPRVWTPPPRLQAAQWGQRAR